MGDNTVVISLFSLVFVQNKCGPGDFSPENVEVVEETLQAIFAKSRLKCKGNKWFTFSARVVLCLASVMLRISLRVIILLQGHAMPSLQACSLVPSLLSSNTCLI